MVIRKRISRAKLLEFFATLPACLESYRIEFSGTTG